MSKNLSPNLKKRKDNHKKGTPSANSQFRPLSSKIDTHHRARSEMQAHLPQNEVLQKKVRDNPQFELQLYRIIKGPNWQALENAIRGGLQLSVMEQTALDALMQLAQRQFSPDQLETLALEDTLVGIQLEFYPSEFLEIYGIEDHTSGAARKAINCLQELTKRPFNTILEVWEKAGENKDGSAILEPYLEETSGSLLQAASIKTKRQGSRPSRLAVVLNRQLFRGIGRVWIEINSDLLRQYREYVKNLPGQRLSLNIIEQNLFTWLYLQRQEIIGPITPNQLLEQLLPTDKLTKNRSRQRNQLIEALKGFEEIDAIKKLDLTGTKVAFKIQKNLENFLTDKKRIEANAKRRKSNLRDT